MLHFYKTPTILKYIFRDLVWNIPTEDKTIYLTFDDGPIPHLTEYVLEQLEQYDAKATFFCVGDNIRKYPEIASNIIDGGHVIGNHTFNHLKGWNTPNDIYEQNIELCQSSIDLYQPKPQKPLFRPPHGQITINQINQLKEKYRIIMWDVLTYDFETGLNAEKNLLKSMKHTNPGSIVVFHDNYKAEQKLKYMLPKYLNFFKTKGYSFKSIG